MYKGERGLYVWSLWVVGVLQRLFGCVRLHMVWKEGLYVWSCKGCVKEKGGCMYGRCELWECCRDCLVV